MHIVSHLDDVGKMLRKRGLEPNGRVQIFLTNECAKEMDPYVPFQSGMLKNRKVIKPDSVTYNSTYAKYQYYGKVMLAPNGSAWAKKGEHKTLTSKELTYNQAPKRGAFWDKRMWADKKHKILRVVAKAAGGTVK